MHLKQAFQRWQLSGHLEMSDTCIQYCADERDCDATPVRLARQLVSQIHFVPRLTK